MTTPHSRGVDYLATLTTMGSATQELPAVPRSNSSSNPPTARPRSRGPARSAAQRAAAADASADRSTSSSAAATSAAGDMPQSPTFDEIAEAAYHRYLRRGGSDGQDFDDWVEAERELRSRRSS